MCMAVLPGFRTAHGQAPREGWVGSIWTKYELKSNDLTMGSKDQATIAPSPSGTAGTDKATPSGAGGPVDIGL